MRAFAIAPKLDVAGDRLIGHASRAARLLWLYSYNRCVTLDRRRRSVTIATTRGWFFTRTRRVPFGEIDRIVLRAQPLAGLGALSTLMFGMAPGVDGALFLISLGLRQGREEVFLFTVWEEQGAGEGFLAAIAWDRDTEPKLGDERIGEILARLREFLAVPVSSH